MHKHAHALIHVHTHTHTHARTHANAHGHRRSLPGACTSAQACMQADENASTQARNDESTRACTHMRPHAESETSAQARKYTISKACK
eukprot:3679806-Alexandrium_andersonii.AAC.1